MISFWWTYYWCIPLYTGNWIFCLRDEYINQFAHSSCVYMLYISWELFFSNYTLFRVCKDVFRNPLILLGFLSVFFPTRLPFKNISIQKRTCIKLVCPLRAKGREEGGGVIAIAGKFANYECFKMFLRKLKNTKTHNSPPRQKTFQTKIFCPVQKTISLFL